MMENSSFEAQHLRRATEKLARRVQKAKAKTEAGVLLKKKKEKGILASFLSWLQS